MRVFVKVLILAFMLLVVPRLAAAQAVIAGVVKDASGAVLPGVTVEASSPALIEKVRTAVTDSTGQYRVENLRPGTYAVTFSLTGFSTYKREGIELTGSFTATIDAEMRVGALQETVTVTGASPIVDVQSARREMTINNDIIRAIPNQRNYGSMVAMVPGVLTNVNDPAAGTVTTQFPVHGGRANESRMWVDGLNIGNPPGGGQPPTYVADIGNAQEIAFTTSGGLGESETAGLVMNVVPKTGGNEVHGAAFYSGTGADLQADNGSGVPPLNHVYDVNISVGGPIAKDKVWYFINGRTQAATRYIPGIFYNNNAGDATKWLYSPDTSKPQFTDRTWENISGRVTWQATPKNKIGGFWDEQVVCRTCEGTTYGITDPARMSPEAGGLSQYKPLRVTQLTWSSPKSNRLLLEAGLGTTYYGWGSFERDPNPTRNLIRVQEQCAGGCANNGGIAGLFYRSQDFALNYTGAYAWRASGSYITGAHSFKIGYQGSYFSDDRTWFTNDQNLTYRVNNGMPNQLTQSISPWVNNARAGWTAFYAQEQWTLGRLTLQGALRFDRAGSWFPAQTIGPTRFLPNAFNFPETKGVDSYNDITPRLGMAWDVFGTGRTALKASFGRYLEGVGTAGNYAGANPTSRLPVTGGAFATGSVSRSWTDVDGDFVPDCDLLNPLANSTGGDSCGTMSNLRFGQNVLTNNYDPNLLKGWGVRPSDWSVNVSVQQQILPRASIEVGYARRSFRGFTVNDNTLAGPADYSSYTITAPSDPRLPNGGNYPISGLLDVARPLAGQILNTVTDSSNFGDWSQYFNGVDVTVSIRMNNGLNFQGGTSTGQSVADACDVRAHLPELNSALGAGLAGSTVSPTSPYCHVAYGVLTQFRGLATYIVPRIDVQVSGVMQSKPGPLLSANYAVPNSVITAALGRGPAGDPPNITINLIEPGTLYGNRINQLDFRVAKLLKFGSTKTMLGVDLFNALNSGAILTYNNNFIPGGTWLQPISILSGRMVKFSAELTF
jgi:Carboxypeptidase regulatory-like domain